MKLSKLIKKSIFSPPLWRGWVGLILFFSCDKDTGSGEPEQPYADGEIRFEIGFAPQTRVATDAQLVSTWEEGDEIGIFAVKSTGQTAGTPQAADNYLHNVKLTYQNGSWTTPATPIYHPNDGEFLDFYAYYPYDSTLNPANPQFTVQTDQYTETNYKKSDLLLAKKQGVTKTTGTVSLNFEHAMALVQVEVKREVTVPPFDENFRVTLTGALTDAGWNWNTPPSGNSSETDITMHKVEGLNYTYRALVPAQTLKATSVIHFTQTTPGAEIDLKYFGIKSATLTAGNAHKYDITVGYGIDTTHEYKIGDAYPHIGPVIGIVYEISNNGKNGKIVSLDELQGTWADHYGDHKATDEDNGLKNMKDIAEYIRTNSYSWTNFPVFNWVHLKNEAQELYTDEHATGIWYLPAITESKALGNAYRNFGTTEFNMKLTNAGGQAFSTALYWSSTSSGTFAYIWDPANGNTTSYNLKTNTYRLARCVLAF